MRLVARLSAAAVAAAGIEVVSGVDSVGDGTAGFALLAAAAVAAGRGRWAWTAAAAGAAWFAGALWAPLAALHRGPVAYSILAYPRLRIPSAVSAVAVAGAAVASFPGAADADALTTAVGVAVVAAAAWRLRGVTGVERRAAAAALVAAAVFGVPLAAVAAVRLGGGDLAGAGLLLYEVCVGTAVLGLAIDLRRGDWAASAVAGLAADLGTLDAPGALSARLGRALGDPGLAVAIRARDGWVDAGGAPIARPVAGPGQVLTPIEDAGVLVHDAVLLEQPALLRGAVAAARLAVDNARLEAEVRASVAEVAASRRRLVEAGDEQRRRLERELRGGAERELEAATEALGASFAELTEEVRSAREDLRRFAHGVHPAALTEQGLGRALEEVARRMPIPVDVQVGTRRREPLLDITAYYVCTEALANAVKHAQAGEARVHVVDEPARLRVEVADDGVGGATLDGDGGLRGLADRVSALGGSLHVRSPPGAGTRVVAIIPL